MQAILSLRLKAAKTSLFSPCSFHCVLVVFEAFMTTKSGSKFSSSFSSGLMNIFLTKWHCHATSIMKRIFIRVSRLVPQKQSRTYSFLLES